MNATSTTEDLGVQQIRLGRVERRLDAFEVTLGRLETLVEGLEDAQNAEQRRKRRGRWIRIAVFAGLAAVYAFYFQRAVAML